MGAGLGLVAGVYELKQQSFRGSIQTQSNEQIHKLLFLLTAQRMDLVGDRTLHRLRVLNQYIALFAVIRSDLEKELPNVKAATKWVQGWV